MEADKKGRQVMSINENTENKDVDMIEEKNRILDESENIQEFNEAMHDMLLRNFFGEKIGGTQSTKEQSNGCSNIRERTEKDLS
jgi:hypothetical protein